MSGLASAKTDPWEAPPPLSVVRASEAGIENATAPDLTERTGFVVGTIPIATTVAAAEDDLDIDVAVSPDTSHFTASAYSEALETWLRRAILLPHSWYPRLDAALLAKWAAAYPWGQSPIASLSERVLGRSSASDEQQEGVPDTMPWSASPSTMSRHPVASASDCPGESLIASIKRAAVLLWEGDDAAARAYLERPSRPFGDLPPLDAAMRSPSAAWKVLTALRSALDKMDDTKRRAKQAEADLRASATPEAVAAAALELWGDVELANTFLNKPHYKLGGRTPEELAAESTEGASAALSLIRQIQDGAPV